MPHNLEISHNNVLINPNMVFEEICNFYLCVIDLFCRTTLKISHNNVLINPVYLSVTDLWPFSAWPWRISHYIVLMNPNNFQMNMPIQQVYGFWGNGHFWSIKVWLAPFCPHGGRNEFFPLKFISLSLRGAWFLLIFYLISAAPPSGGCFFHGFFSC